MSPTINYTTIKLQIPKFCLVLVFDVMDGFTTIYIYIYNFKKKNCGEFLPFCELFFEKLYIMLQILYF
jgi:hypothetical protein